jgi:hypothetical protein
VKSALGKLFTVVVITATATLMAIADFATHEWSGATHLLALSLVVLGWSVVVGVALWAPAA